MSALALVTIRESTPPNYHSDIDIDIEAYKTVRIVLTTRIAHGLTDADVDFAKRIDG